MSKHLLADWYAALGAAIRAEDVQAVPGLLVLMALDGYGHEAEQWRRETSMALSVASASDAEVGS